MLRLTAAEWDSLRSQIVISGPRHGGRLYAPYAFTEQGVAMLSSVLRSPQAIAVNIQVMRAFVRMRELLSSNRELTRQFAQLEARLNKRVGDHDKAIAAILSAIRQLMDKPVPKRRGIGFTANLWPAAIAIGTVARAISTYPAKLLYETPALAPHSATRRSTLGLTY